MLENRSGREFREMPAGVVLPVLGAGKGVKKGALLRTGALRGLLPVLWAGLAVLGAPPGIAATAQVAVDVPEGKTRTIRLRRLPRGAVIAVSVVASGKLRLALVSALQLKSRKPEALFRGVLERRLSFRVVIPESSDYYLVLDNRRGAAPVKATATIRAEKKAAPPKPKTAPGGADEERAALPPRGWPLLAAPGEREDVAEVVVQVEQVAPRA